MICKRADQSEIKDAVGMRLAFIRDTYRNLSAEQTNEIKEQLEGYFAAHLNKDIFVYLCYDNETSVSSVFLTVSEKPASVYIMTGKYGTLINVYTAPEYRKRGMAGTLVRMAVDDAKTMNLAYIDLKASEMGAPLYAELGFIREDSAMTPMKYRLL